MQVTRISADLVLKRSEPVAMKQGYLTGVKNRRFVVWGVLGLFLIAGCSGSSRRALDDPGTSADPGVVADTTQDVPLQDDGLSGRDAGHEEDLFSVDKSTGKFDIVRDQGDGWEAWTKDLPGEETRDYTRDSDGDGVSDGDETDQGTDPHDPSDALQWHPEIDEYPRLFFGPREVDQVKARIKSWLDGPLQGLLHRMHNECDRKVPGYTKPYDPYVDEARGKIAKTCAFLAFYEGDQDAATKAASIVNAVGTDFTGINVSSSFYTKWDIRVAEGVEGYLVAFDLLAAAGYTPLDPLKQRLSAFCDAVFDYGTTQDPRFLLTTCRNNHAVKFASAIGMCGMMFNHRARAALYVDFAATFVDFLMDYLLDKDGGDAEGPGYDEYSAVNHLPFFAAYHRLVGKTRSYKALNLLRLKPPSRPMVEVRDFVANPKILANNDWFLNIVMPDGRAPNIEDANLTPALAGLIAGIFHDDRFLANWAAPGVDYSMSAGGFDMMPETLCLLGRFHTVQPYQPPAFVLMPDAGDAVFRGKDGSWLMVLAEHGPAVAHGGGHEQMDPTQWLYAAMGEYLVLDSGYIQWEQRDLVAHPKNHNMILVDNEGPDDGMLATPTDGFLDAGDAHMVGAHTEYRGCHIRRNYYFFNTSIAVASFVQCDQTRKLTQLLHLNAGGDTDGKLSVKQDGLFDVNRKHALAYGVNTCIGSTCEYTQHQDYHAFAWGKKHKHVVLDVSCKAQNVTFFNALFVNSPGKPATVVEGRTNHGICVMITTDHPQVMCECTGNECSVITGNYQITIKSGFTRFIFDKTTLKVETFYGQQTPPEIKPAGT